MWHYAARKVKNPAKRGSTSMGPPLAHCKDNDPHYDKASYRLTREPSDVMPGADAWLNFCHNGGTLARACFVIIV